MILTRELNAEGHDSALSFIFSEAKKGRNSIGFVPWKGVEDADLLGRLAVLYRNDDLVGFLLFGPSKTNCKVFQIWIREDARLLIHGRLCIDWLSEWARRRGLSRLSLWCADDLPAATFWRALGFNSVANRVVSKRSGRRQTRFVCPTAVGFRGSSQSRVERTAVLEKSIPRSILPGQEVACPPAKQWQPVFFDPT